MFNRVPADDRADENQAESAHKVLKMTLTMAELADELHISLPTAGSWCENQAFPRSASAAGFSSTGKGFSAGWMVSHRLLSPEFFRKMYLPRAGMCAMIIVAP